MSARESSDARRASDWPTRFARWRGQLSLTLGVVLGPVVALVNQQGIYSVDIWACGHNARGTIHIVPALSLIVVCGVALSAYLNLRTVGLSPEDEHADIGTRSRFMAILGVSLSVFSALVILAQWLGVFLFDPCIRQ